MLFARFRVRGYRIAQDLCIEIRTCDFRISAHDGCVDVRKAGFEAFAPATYLAVACRAASEEIAGQVTVVVTARARPNADVAVQAQERES